MNYVDELAEAIRRAVAPQFLPEGDTGPLFRLYALLALVKGEGVSREDVHNAWAVWMSERDPHHPAIQPYGDLSPETQREDQPFVDAIRHVVSSRRASGR